MPWLALGGGGYDVNAVARAWTLAYGVMLETDWPDQLPIGFAKEYGAGRLRDELSPEVPYNIKVDVRRHLEETLGAVRQQIFPLHGL